MGGLGARSWVVGGFLWLGLFEGGMTDERQRYYHSMEFEVRRRKERKLMELEMREIVHRRIWLGRAACQISVRRVVRAAGDKNGLKRAQLRLYYVACCRIIESIGGRVDGVTKRSWNNGDSEDWETVKHKLAERIYLYEEEQVPEGDELIVE